MCSLEDPTIDEKIIKLSKNRACNDPGSILVKFVGEAYNSGGEYVTASGTMIQPWNAVQRNNTKKVHSKFKAALKLARMIRLCKLNQYCKMRPILKKWIKSTIQWKKKIKLGSIVRSVVTLNNSSALICGNIVWSKLNMSSVQASPPPPKTNISSSSSSNSISSAPKKRKTSVLWWPCQIQYPHDPTDKLVSHDKQRKLGKYKVQPLGANIDGTRYKPKWITRNAITFFNTRIPSIDILKTNHSYEGAVQDAISMIESAFKNLKIVMKKYVFTANGDESLTSQIKEYCLLSLKYGVLASPLVDQNPLTNHPFIGKRVKCTNKRRQSSSSSASVPRDLGTVVMFNPTSNPPTWTIRYDDTSTTASTNATAKTTTTTNDDNNQSNINAPLSITSKSKDLTTKKVLSKIREEEINICGSNGTRPWVPCDVETGKPLSNIKKLKHLPSNSSKKDSRYTGCVKINAKVRWLAGLYVEHLFSLYGGEIYLYNSNRKYKLYYIGKEQFITQQHVFQYLTSKEATAKRITSKRTTSKRKNSKTVKKTQQKDNTFHVDYETVCQWMNTYNQIYSKKSILSSSSSSSQSNTRSKINVDPPPIDAASEIIKSPSPEEESSEEEYSSSEEEYSSSEEDSSSSEEDSSSESDESDESEVEEMKEIKEIKVMKEMKEMKEEQKKVPKGEQNDIIIKIPERYNVPQSITGNIKRSWTPIDKGTGQVVNNLRYSKKYKCEQIESYLPKFRLIEADMRPTLILLWKQLNCECWYYKSTKCKIYYVGNTQLFSLMDVIEYLLSLKAKIDKQTPYLIPWAKISIEMLSNMYKLASLPPPTFADDDNSIQVYYAINSITKEPVIPHIFGFCTQSLTPFRIFWSPDFKTPHPFVSTGDITNGLSTCYFDLYFH